ncbi:hypothetical protein Q4511_09105 [Paracoccus sp. 1_MG-2023]|uniref:capsular polysaccharide export protein, LipB/KpsS family n=1 Tax=unclassified Paracoccus (in: a-proteobacteria) TaxID=2688777 RepID=UPI001C0A2439|nr:MULTISPECIES: hypothetical protein [unclassified Paracoccus (in: a-proteobacteria)]MBU2957192.1 hypothetical protein [Paracoccus sp. C2R09]MDO6669079.1 hypothetical protein [Paracoccus sp. 1_MG-2023]
MGEELLLNVYLYPPVLQMAKAGRLGFLNRMTALLEARGWTVRIRHSGEGPRARAPARPGYALFNMERPTHDRALTFRRAYHYPYWRLEPQAERWRWPIAQARFDPDLIEDRAAANFARRLRRRVLPGADPVRGDHILIPLQGHLRKQRSFQSASPIGMIRHAAMTGRPCIATLHPKEVHDDRDHAALGALQAEYPNLTIGGETAVLLRDCAFVVTQNSAVGFDALILGKPLVLFAQSDFHHVALNAADLGADPAIAMAAGHAPPTDKFLDWFLRRNSLDMMAPDADDRLLSAMKKGGWPV